MIMRAPVTNQVPDFIELWFMQSVLVLNYNRLAAEDYVPCATECGVFFPI